MPARPYLVNLQPADDNKVAFLAGVAVPEGASDEYTAATCRVAGARRLLDSPCNSAVLLWSLRKRGMLVLLTPFDASRASARGWRTARA